MCNLYKMWNILSFILLLVCNRALYWFTSIGSDTIFYSNECLSSPIGYSSDATPFPAKGPQWKVAHPLTLNYKAPIASRDATICVSSGGTPCGGITKGFKFVKFLCFACYSKQRNFTNVKPFVIPTYRVPSPGTHMVASIAAIGAS